MIGRHARHIELAELEPAATAKLLHHVAAGYAFDEAQVQQIHQLTGGNPGFIVDTAHACLRHATPNASIPVHVGVPSAVRVIIDERLAELSTEARGLLGIASAIGNTFAPQLLSNLVPLTMKDAAPRCPSPRLSALFGLSTDRATVSYRNLSRKSCTKDSQ